MAACVGIYMKGDHPFSREAVAEAFAPIAGVIYLTLGVLVLTAVEAFIWGETEEKKPGKKIEKLCVPDAAEAKKINTARLVVLVIGVGFFAYGLATGGVADVLAKAVNICTECIGLG